MKTFSCFKPKDPFRNWSKELDKRVAMWAENFNSSFKLLLLGPAGAGKTTIMKQMKIIHFEGFSLEERQQKALEIRSNLLESVRELTGCIRSSGYEINWCDKENQARLDFINGLNLDEQTYELYAAKIYDYSKRILTDKGVEELFAQLSQLSITHRSQYLLNRVEDIRNVNYIPNNDDILQSRRRTSDIQKLEFQVNLPVKSGQNMQQTFCMFDVGGQRGERRKWIQVFDGVSAVMFLIDSSSFDATDEENGRNKLRETINLFYEVWTTRFLLNSNFVLLFNKQDILKEKIERGHKIEDHFPEFKNYKCNYSNDRALLSRSGEKLNLFRSGSGRSTRASTTSSRSSGFTSTPGSPNSTGGSIREKRKSSSYGFSNNGSKSGKVVVTGPTTSLSFVSATNTLGAAVSNPHNVACQQHYQAARTGAHVTNTSSSPAALRKSATSNQSLDPSATESIEQSFLRARSFIRDKFLQITRQVEQDSFRKFSTPNCMYNTRGSTGVDHPKRNVFYHYTTATDTENIRDLFENLQRMVIKSVIQ